MPPLMADLSKFVSLPHTGGPRTAAAKSSDQRCEGCAELTAQIECAKQSNSDIGVSVAEGRMRRHLKAKHKVSQS